MVTLTKIQALKGIELGIDNSILDKLIEEIELLVVALKMTSYQIDIEETMSNEGFYLVGFQASKDKQNIYFDLLCTPSDLTVKHTSFMVMGNDEKEADNMSWKLAKQIESDLYHLGDFELTKRKSMVFVKTISETNLNIIPYLIEQMRKQIIY
jgi:hypothetical protein